MAAFSVLRDEYADIAILYASISNQDGALDVGYTPPPGFGDSYVLETYFDANPAATAVALSAANNGWGVSILSSGSTKAWVAADLVRSTGARFFGHAKPDVPVLLKETDTLQFIMAELDTNVTPQIDFYFFVRVQRLRAVGPRPL